ncbi:MAG: nodulation protein [Cyanomargarita calcarea GSE-NOS-MK-12-04C]|jgi:predicted NodU family carbamoyl transferase|uniref:Nodulation protein n=1 Tax=Cyanomargarita calcarea GSE-NOS-MK-12-04C TaxID=2839659 RepID=A0A951QSW5_9CYAN|nr:nodulation protein [Cyanomargarita calcarea GSE-NOS-MK-12-04C]
MLVLGLSGFFSEIERDFIPNLPSWYYHDSAAVLMENGKIIAAAEEERLNRIKHTNKFCVQSIRYCLEQHQVNISDVDYIGFYFAENFIDYSLNLEYIKAKNIPLKYARELIISLLAKEFGYQFPPEKLIFTSHHQAHAYSTYFHSGFSEALVVVMDGRGESESITIFNGQQKQLKTLKKYPVEISLGDFYQAGTELLGYSLFDEYKVMGLAPYGNPERFRSYFQSLYNLLPNGWYELNPWGVHTLFLKERFFPRRKEEDFNQTHKDFAASLQETLETITKHILTHWQKITGHTKLCMAGGVAHNCSLNGKVLYSGLFDKIFVHPASHDAGAAIGAAMMVDQKYNHQFAPLPLVNVYWGSDVGSNDDVEFILKQWSGFVDFLLMENTPVEVAKLIATGSVIGWLQGKTEFGPRALGNRSILADPRVSENKTRINAMVKKREGYRPFAPSVIVEAADEIFELPQQASSFGYMTFAIKVKEDKRQFLGAITHIDGTSRIQTVTKTSNSKFWNLINEFGKMTQVPVLLNTSFNNNVEPVVNSCLEAITCFLTTNLNYLVINDFLITKLSVSWKDYYQKMILSLVTSAQLKEVSMFNCQEQNLSAHEVYFSYTGGKSLLIMPETYNVLKKSDNRLTVEQIANSLEISENKLEDLTQELIKLWENRLINFRPLQKDSNRRITKQ